MAIWQFTLYLIPKASVEQRLKEIPSRMSLDLAEDTAWWSGHQPPKGFEDAICKILPEASSWSKQMRIWGNEDTDAIWVGYRTDEKLEVEDIRIRIDVSRLSWELVLRVCQWATSLDCLAYTQTHEVISLDFFAIEEAIKNSRAMKFLSDPAKTLQSLDQKEFEK